MDSKVIYSNLCETRKEMVGSYGPGSGLHKHHIVPSHSGGSNDESNFTYLTVREHILAHYLLWRIYKNPNDLRSMKMLGAKLSVEQRKIIGEWCRDNNIGFFCASKEERLEWAMRGMESQKLSGDKNSFYWWSTEEGRKKRASMGGSKTCSDPTTPWGYWASSEGQRERASMGGKALKGMIAITNGKHRTRVKLEDLDQWLAKGYRRGFTLSS